MNQSNLELLYSQEYKWVSYDESISLEFVSVHEKEEFSYFINDSDKAVSIPAHYLEKHNENLLSFYNSFGDYSIEFIDNEKIKVNLPEFNLIILKRKKK